MSWAAHGFSDGEIVSLGSGQGVWGMVPEEEGHVFCAGQVLARGPGPAHSRADRRLHWLDLEAHGPNLGRRFLAVNPPTSAQRAPWMVTKACRSCPGSYIRRVTEHPVTVNSNLAAVKNHSRTYEEFLFVYPVISRRSRGLSIGVNLNPDKVCNFDCIYCEVDRRTPPRAWRVEPARLREELGQMIALVRTGGLFRQSRFNDAAALATDIKDIAFSGDGEPTMIPNFAECVQLVADVKQQERLDSTKIVLITDAAGLDKADVRRGLEIMDANNGEIWGKLDAGTEAYFKLVNRSPIRFDRILKNLLDTARVRPIAIQSLFLRVHDEPMPATELTAYCERLNELRRDGAQIKEVQAYTVARPTPEAFATRLTSAELEAVATTIRQETGLAVSAFE